MDETQKPLFEPGPIIDPKYGKKADYVHMEAQVLVPNTADARATEGVSLLLF